MKSTVHTKLASAAGLLWKVIESYDLDPEPVFLKTGIDLKLLNDPSARISSRAIDSAYDYLSQNVNDPCMGMKLGQFWHPSHMGSLGYAWLASSTLSTALVRLSRYVRIVDDAISVNLHEEQDQLVVTIIYDQDEESANFHADAASSILLTMCRANYGEGLNPISVSFKHAVSKCSGEYYSFFRCPVEFEAKENRIVLSLDAVNKPLTSSNPQLAQLNDQVMVNYLAKLEKEDIVQQVKVAILNQLPSGNVTDETISEAVLLSKRSLQRRLNERDTTFKTILTEIRTDLALRYIQDQMLTLTEISFMLGFSEMSSFSRAFKRWTGESPKDFRGMV